MSLSPRIDAVESSAIKQNHALNGNFDIWQRGTSFSTGGAGYGADRMAHFIFNSTITRESSDLVGSTYHARCTMSTAAGYTYIYQPFEAANAKALHGKTVTLSFYARKSAGYNGVFATDIQKNSTANTQSGGSWTSVGGVSSPTLTTAWTKFTLTQTIPSDGSAAGLRFAIWGGTSTGLGYWEVAQIMINEGSIAAPFQRAGGTIGGELALCQRYYEKSYDVDQAPGASTSQIFYYKRAINASEVDGATFHVEKRIAPAVVLYDSSGNPNRINNVATASTAQYRFNKGFGYVAVTGGGLTANSAYGYFYTADAEIN